MYLLFGSQANVVLALLALEFTYGSKTMVQRVEQEQQLTVLNAENGNYCLNRDVFLVIQNDMAQILDFHRGQFYGLDAIATSMVSLVLETGVEEAIAHTIQTYNVTEEVVRTDLTALLQDLERKQLLVTTDRRGSFTLLHDWMTKTRQLLAAICLWVLRVASLIFCKLFNRRHPSRYTVDLLLTLSWLSFRLLGWSSTILLWQHWHRCADPLVDSAQEAIETVDRVVREAAASKLFLPMVCKERALVGYHLLRAFYALPATLVIGIDRYPFQVHAWVESNGRVISDRLEHCQSFTPVVKYS